MIADPILFLSGTRSIAIPRDFAAQVCEDAIVNYGQWKDKLSSLADMASEGYWDTWDDVCQNMILQDLKDKYKRYTLWQDGDLWLHPHPNNIKWVTDIVPAEEYELYNNYDLMLDECYDGTTIAGHKYKTSYALKNLDPVAYRCGFSEWLDSECTDKELFEGNDGEYYPRDPSEPDDYWDDPASHDGHYEWIVPREYSDVDWIEFHAN